MLPCSAVSTALQCGLSVRCRQPVIALSKALSVGSADPAVAASNTRPSRRSTVRHFALLLSYPVM